LTTDTAIRVRGLEKSYKQLHVLRGERVCWHSACAEGVPEHGPAVGPNGRAGWRPFDAATNALRQPRPSILPP